jgi:hypothetical protein
MRGKRLLLVVTAVVGLLLVGASFAWQHMKANNFS